MVTVGALQNLPIFNKIDLQTEDVGMDNHVTNITIVETFESTDWINGHEFLLMSHSFLKLTLVEKIAALDVLAKLHVAAVGVKLVDTQDSIAREIIDHACMIGLPIFSFSQEVAYLDIMNPVNQHILTVQERQMEVERFTQRLIYSSNRKAQYLYEHSTFMQQHPASTSMLPLLISHQEFSKQEDEYLAKEFEHKIVNMLQRMKKEQLITHFLQFNNYNDYCYFLFFNKEHDLEAEINHTILDFFEKVRVLDVYPKLSPVCGIGLIQTELFNFKKAFDEAEAASQLGAALAESDEQIIFYYKDAILFDLLSLDSDVYADYFRNFLDEHLNTEEMIETLTSYFQAEENIVEASKLMYVHPNTVRYRIEKVKNETGLDVNNMRSKTILYLYCVHKKLYQHEK